MSLRQAELREGKIYLDDRVIPDPEILGLDIIESAPPELPRPSFLRFEEAVKQRAPLNADSYLIDENKRREGGYVNTYSILTPILYLNCRIGGK